MSSNDPISRSKQFILAARKGDDQAAEIQSDLCSLDRDRLEQSLDSDRAKKAFWTNTYNGYVQLLLRNNPDLYSSTILFFLRRHACIAGKDMSLNKIEHGMLRRSQFSFGMGYLRNPFPGSFEQRFRVDELDPRIHFALNCGAASCPAVGA
jgi:hypothetical protein